MSIRVPYSPHVVKVDTATMTPSELLQDAASYYFLKEPKSPRVHPPYETRGSYSNSYNPMPSRCDHVFLSPREGIFACECVECGFTRLKPADAEKELKYQIEKSRPASFERRGGIRVPKKKPALPPKPDLAVNRGPSIPDHLRQRAKATQELQVKAAQDEANRMAIFDERKAMVDRLQSGFKRSPRDQRRVDSVLAKHAPPSPAKLKKAGVEAPKRDIKPSLKYRFMRDVVAPLRADSWWLDWCSDYFDRHPLPDKWGRTGSVDGYQVAGAQDPGRIERM